MLKVHELKVVTPIYDAIAGGLLLIGLSRRELPAEVYYYFQG